jgi:hypothetical protein
MRAGPVFLNLLQVGIPVMAEQEGGILPLPTLILLLVAGVIFVPLLMVATVHELHSCACYFDHVVVVPL